MDDVVVVRTRRGRCAVRASRGVGGPRAVASDRPAMERSRMSYQTSGWAHDQSEREARRGLDLGGVLPDWQPALSWALSARHTIIVVYTISRTGFTITHAAQT